MENQKSEIRNKKLVMRFVKVQKEGETKDKEGRDLPAFFV